MRLVAILTLGLLLAGPATAQHGHGHGAGHGGGPGPYAGFQSRDIAALSDEDVAGLRAGRGMGLALAAELNGYPGPMHVLELAAELALTAEQRARVEALFHEMRAETIPLGEAVIERERALDRAFRERTVTRQSLVDLTDAVGAAQARLRRAHLSFHLATIEVLTADQTRRYAVLRGYATAHR